MNRIYLAGLLCIVTAVSCLAETFTPKSYIKAVLDSSLSMRKAEESLKQAEDSYWSSILDTLLPSLSLSMSNGLYDNREPIWRFRKKEVISSLSASWSLYDSASSPAAKLKRVKLDHETAQLAFFTSKQNEALKAITRFNALYSAQKRLATAKANLASRESQYNDTNSQYQSGTRSKAEVTQSEGDKLQSELALAQAESAWVKALISFNELINVDFEAPQEALISTQAAVTVTLPFPKEDIGKALADNFSLRQQRLSLEKTRLENHTNLLSNLPRFKVDASWRKSSLGWFGTPASAWDEDRTYNVGASLSFPFGFMGVQNYLDVSAKKSALRSSELEMQNSVRSLRVSVLSAQKDIELQVKSQKLLEFQIKAQKEAVDNLLLDYSQGGANSQQLDVVYTKLLDARNNLINAVNDLDVSLVNYRVLLGEKIWE